GPGIPDLVLRDPGRRLEGSAEVPGRAPGGHACAGAGRGPPHPHPVQPDRGGPDTARGPAGRPAGRRARLRPMRGPVRFLAALFALCLASGPAARILLAADPVAPSPPADPRALAYPPLSISFPPPA